MVGFRSAPSARSMNSSVVGWSRCACAAIRYSATRTCADFTSSSCLARTNSVSFVSRACNSLAKAAYSLVGGGSANNGGTVGSAAGEHAVQCVVVPHRNRVELVVVAAGAADRQAEQAAADHVDAVVDDVVGVVHEAPAQRQEAQRGQRAPVLPQGQPVGGELLDEELVVGQVVVEGADDVVAIGPGPGELSLLEEDIALGVGEAGHVEPVPAP